MITLFAALALPADARDALADVSVVLPGARLIDPDDMHMTVCYFGPMPEPVADDLCNRLSTLRADPIIVSFGAVAAFGGDRARSIYLAVEKTRALVELHRAVAGVATDAGLELDTRKFTPHITLARLPRSPAAEVALALAEIGHLDVPPFQTSTLGLYTSARSRGGGPYILEAQFDLRPDAHAAPNANHDEDAQ
ncbi:MAG: RNA 2',3'-cyclic phosphodiesterase [Pseudomonadota bacterium]